MKVGVVPEHIPEPGLSRYYGHGQGHGLGHEHRPLDEARNPDGVKDYTDFMFSNV